MGIRKHSKNIFYVFSGDVVVRMVGFLVITYLARILGSSDFGVISIAAAVLAYGSILSNCGLAILGTRKVAAGSIITFLLTRIR